MQVRAEDKFTWIMPSAVDNIEEEEEDEVNRADMWRPFRACRAADSSLTFVFILLHIDKNATARGGVGIPIPSAIDGSDEHAGVAVAILCKSHKVDGFAR